MASPESSAQGLFPARLQKSAHAGAIAGEPPELVAPPAEVLPATPVAVPVPGTPPPPDMTPGPTDEEEGAGIEGGAVRELLPAAPPALLPGTELPRKGSLSS
ncbi:MAG: hypothetical protein ABI488_12315, partial [Polyangiaceae bacterium]